jgi:hypothetical protein
MGREERGLRVRQNETRFVGGGGFRLGEGERGLLTYCNARGGRVLLTPAEHLLRRRQSELSGLSLNFRIVVAADLDSVAINAKSGC